MQSPPSFFFLHFASHRQRVISLMYLSSASPWTALASRKLMPNSALLSFISTGSRRRCRVSVGCCGVEFEVVTSLSSSDLRNTTAVSSKVGAVAGVGAVLLYVRWQVFLETVVDCEVRVRDFRRIAGRATSGRHALVRWRTLFMSLGQRGPIWDGCGGLVIT